MQSYRWARGAAAWVLLSVVAGSGAATHRDWTVVPLGSFPLTEGEQTIQLTRPYDRFGVIPSPIVLTALFDVKRTVSEPAELRLALGEREWPAWKIERIGQMYVIGLGALGPVGKGEMHQTLTLRVNVKNPGLGLALMASGAPDLALAGEAALGPLEDVVQRMERGAAREYLLAAGQASTAAIQTARAEFARLAQGTDETVARFARAALRRLRFADAEFAVHPNFAEHYRMGLYAQQCGLFRSARLHLESALHTLVPGQPGPSDWYVSDAWFRLGEMMERCGEPIADVAEATERAGEVAHVTPNVWDVWVTILQSEEVKATEGANKPGEAATTTRVPMTMEQDEKIKREWHWVEQMVYGASGGHFKLNTRFREIPDTSAVPYGMNLGWLYGPLDALVPVRGSVDCVMSFRPRGPSVTGGADCGPNGAALTDIGTWCGWEVYLHEWNHQFDWTVRTDEAADGYPITHHSDSCGHQPIPSMGYGHRASMRYYVPAMTYHRIQPADPDPGAGYLLNWGVDAPIEIHETPPKKDLPPHHVLDFPPDKRPMAARAKYEVQGQFKDFIDLKAFYASQGVALPPWYVSTATTFVQSPRRQEVRLWLGHNDGMAVWLNGELIHRGDYYAIAKFEDQNWPNMAMATGVLQEGQNRLDVAVESWPAPRDKGHGFSVRVCDFLNRPVPGVHGEYQKLQALPPVVPPVKPVVGQFYTWDEVRDDYYRKLPRLSAADMAKRAGLAPGFKITAKIGATHGYVALGPAEGGPAGFPRALPERWDPQKGVDTRLNNVMDWNREAVAVYPFARTDPREPARYYLVLRPEAIDAYLTCVREVPAARELYQSRMLRQRVLGYIQVGEDKDDEGVRVLIVAEACLPTPLPADEEDLLSPAGE